MNSNILIAIIDKDKVYFTHNTFFEPVVIKQTDLIVDNNRLYKNKYHFLRKLPPKRTVFTILQLLVMKGKVRIYIDQNASFFFIAGVKEIFYKMNVFREIYLLERKQNIFSSINDEINSYLIDLKRN